MCPTIFSYYVDNESQDSLMNGFSVGCLCTVWPVHLTQISDCQTQMEIRGWLQICSSRVTFDDPETQIADG